MLTQTDIDAQGNTLVAYTFNYDAAGNIVQEQITPESPLVLPPSVEMTYTAANRLATFNGQAVQFDADGNLLTAPLNGTMANLSFDSRNRLIQAGTTTYRYDSENQRISVNQTCYIINSQPALSQVLIKESNGIKTFYVYGLGLIGEEINGQYRVYHFDFRGSTVALTNETGQVTQRFQYAPYGELVGGNSSVTPFLFNGMYGVMTDDDGLYYMRAQYYSPEIKRFVNQDILLGEVSKGQNLNRFAYVTGNPVSFVDPFGLESTTGRCAIGAYDCLLYGLNNPVMREFGEQLLGITPGDFGSRIVDEARKHIGSSQWSYYGSVGGLCWFRSKTNKCNKFVYDVLIEAGVPVPTMNGIFGQCPPLARDWADSKINIEGWEIVTGLPQPGDVVAVQHEYSDAKGMSGLFLEKTLPSHNHLELTVW